MSEQTTGYPSIDKPWLQYYRQEVIDETIPSVSLYEMIWEKNKDFQNNKALRYMNLRISYGELFKRIDEVTSAFLSIGVKKNDIIGVSMVNTPESVYVFYALNRIGAVANMIDPRTNEEGIYRYIEETGTKIVIVIEPAAKKFISIGNKIDIKIICVSPVESLSKAKRFLYGLRNHISDSKVMSWSTFIGKGSELKELKKSDENDCCVIEHTGGTTGKPKSVMLSNKNINAVAMQSIWTDIDMQRNHTWMNIMPPFIAYGIAMGLHLPLVIGMEIILIPNFDVKKFDLLLDRNKPNHMVGVPSYWGVIINSKRLRNKDLSYIIAPTVGGDSMDVSLEESANLFLKNHNCKYGITKGYGMTEVAGGVTGTIDANNKIGSVGIPFAKCVISAFTESGEECRYGQIGEICISGPNVMLGYLGDEKATSQIKKIHSDGTEWIHSGDVGYVADSGEVYIVDRIKRMIIRHDGFKVFPSMIEKAIMSNKYIEKCCVVGIKDETHFQGKIPVAYIVVKKDIVLALEKVKQQIYDECKKNLPEYAVPRNIFSVDDLPLTNIGKVDYRALEASYVQSGN